MRKVKLGVFLIGLALAMPLSAQDTESIVKPAVDQKSDLPKEKETISMPQMPASSISDAKENPFKNMSKKYKKDAEDRKAAAERQAADGEKKKFGPGVNKPKDGEDSNSVTTEKKKFGPGITKPKDGEEINSMGISPWRGLLGLTLIAALLGVFFYFLKRLGRKFTGTDAGAMTVKSRLQLDSKNSIVIVKAYDEEFLIGVGSNGVNLISRFMPIDSPEMEDEESEDNNKPLASKQPDFAGNLKSIIDSEEIKPIKDKKL